ncbi:hypothetical protein C0J52_06408 [Blattella germanica]|nr:hypothetical protein C0J52_06408 [Blattella germanica]
MRRNCSMSLHCEASIRAQYCKSSQLGSPSSPKSETKAVHPPSHIFQLFLKWKNFAQLEKRFLKTVLNQLNVHSILPIWLLIQPFIKLLIRLFHIQQWDSKLSAEKINMLGDEKKKQHEVDEMKEEPEDFEVKTEEVTLKYEISDELEKMAKRVVNFTLKEKKKLNELVKAYAIVESKAYKTSVLQQKKTAWESITKAFNRSFPESKPRDRKMLIGLWRRMKLQAKSNVGQKESVNKGTGGGSPGSPLSKVDENVGVILGDSPNPLENPYDDEGEYSEEQNPIEHVATLEIPVLELQNDSNVNDPLGPTNPVFGSTPIHKSQSSKRKLLRSNEEWKMLKEMHEKQMHILDIQEKKVKLQLYLLEQEILKKGFELPEWHTN